jgi:hypothetical protein
MRLCLPISFSAGDSSPSHSSEHVATVLSVEDDRVRKLAFLQDGPLEHNRMQESESNVPERVRDIPAKSTNFCIVHQ